jgi:hypothetical protein
MVVAMIVPAEQLVTPGSAQPSARSLLRELLKRLVVRYGSELPNQRQGEGAGQDTGVTVSENDGSYNVCYPVMHAIQYALM